MDNFLDGLGNSNSIEPQAGIQLFGLAFTIADDLRITFDITERADANVVMPGDLLRLGIGGYEDFIGKINRSLLPGQMQDYIMRSGIGASKNIAEKLRVGARA
ncbi:MAG: DUF5723 family protein [Bacteroidales bacterium]